MGGEIIEIKQNQEVGSLPVTSQDVEALKRQRTLLREFISSQLVEADFSNQNSANYGEGFIDPEDSTQFILTDSDEVPFTYACPEPP